jgi:hypothetical protein
MQTAMYLDLASKEREQMFFFLLNAFLCSRLDTKNETEEDENVNMYITQLLYTLFDGSFFGRSQMLATSPSDVHAMVEQEDTDRHKLRVYRANADYRLVAFGIFAGFGERQSRARRQLTSESSHLEEAQQYYGWAALYGNRLPRKYRGLSQTLATIAAQFAHYLEVLRHMSARYFNLCRRLSPGEVFHLEREAHQQALPYIEDEALNQMLDAYNQWRQKPNEVSRGRLELASSVYKQFNPNFEAGDLGGAGE